MKNYTSTTNNQIILDDCNFVNQSNSYEDKLLYFPTSSPELHTMYNGLHEYVTQKLPVLEILCAINNKQTIEIHGLYPEYAHYTLTGYSYRILKEIKFYHIPHIKAYNFIRPKFYIAVNPSGHTVLIVAVTPGRDYIYHYTGLIRQYLASYTSNYNNLYKVIRYPKIESTITDWTFLRSFINEGDKVAVGYVNEIQQYLENNIYSLPIEVTENNYYVSKRYKLQNNQTVNFLGVKYSFWGNMSALITTTLCEQGAQEILYLGKLGTFGSPQEIYNKIFSPTQFVVMEYTKVLANISCVSNTFVEKFPEYNTGLHVSVPTVMEEDLKLRKIAQNLGAQSIDNEISKMANSIYLFNKAHNTQISFVPIHFATDYIRKSQDSHKSTEVGLHNNRKVIHQNKKHKMIKAISHKLWSYLNI